MLNIGNIEALVWSLVAIAVGAVALRIIWRGDLGQAWRSAVALLIGCAVLAAVFGGISFSQIGGEVLVWLGIGA